MLVLAGTKDARELTAFLLQHNKKVSVSVVTEQAAQKYKSLNIPINIGRLTKEQMLEMVLAKKFKAIIDATHPYAELVSKYAMEVAKEVKIPYLRYERPSTVLNENQYLHFVSSYLEAIEWIREKKGVVFVTTGINKIDRFAKSLLGEANIRLIFRILPTAENLQKCESLGIPKENIIAMQGIFSAGLNQAIYKEYGINLLITKESGKEGGFLEKVESAIQMGIETIVIQRPKLQYPIVFHHFEDLLKYLEKH
ncbi:MAG: precorrin-6A reductase [Tepidibacillus sp.]